MSYLGTAQLRRARRKASKRGLPADLSVDEWEQTCRDFAYRCAYCGVNDSTTLDHFIPLTAGAGTCIDNCLPCCAACNLSKGGSLPQHFLRRQPLRYAQLALYLRSRRLRQSFPLPWLWQPGGEPMRNTHNPTSHQLTCGKKIQIYASLDDQLTLLQLRQEASPDDPRSQGFVVVAQLTPSECVALAISLLQHASVNLVDVRLPEASEPPRAQAPWKSALNDMA